MRVKGIVFYGNNSEREDAINFLTDKLEYLYPNEKPTRIVNCINEYRIEYGEDCWYCYRATEYRRGLRGNIIFYSSTIDKELVNTVIRPQCRCIMQEIYLY